MTTYSVKNDAIGARGVGQFLIEAGASLDLVELSEDEALLLGELDGVTVSESKPTPKTKADDGK